MLSSSFTKFTAISFILAGIMGVLNLLFAAMAANWDFEMLGQGKLFINMPQENLCYFKASYLADILGWYVMFIPGLVYIWRYTKIKSPGFGNYAFVNGLVYLVMGLIGATFLYHTVPVMLEEYYNAEQGSVESAAAKSVFNGFVVAGFHSFFQNIQPITGGAWFLTIGYILKEYKLKFSSIFLIIGFARIAQAIITYLELSPIAAEAMYYVYLFLFPAWMIYAGFYLLSGKKWLESLAE